MFKKHFYLNWVLREQLELKTIENDEDEDDLLFLHAFNKLLNNDSRRLLTNYGFSDLSNNSIINNQLTHQNLDICRSFDDVFDSISLKSEKNFIENLNLFF